MVTEVCGEHIGPVPKLDNEIFVCVEPLGHDLPHKSAGGAWWEQPETLADLRRRIARGEDVNA